ncbi:MerR family transcriptional regulator [Sphaerisporangium melleum]|nr:MerR family transcriptional regulator [Sphaerisporangium melleum]
MRRITRPDAGGTPVADRSMSIGVIAARFGLAPQVLRRWESAGLLAPPRDTRGRRRYEDADLFRVAVILRAREAGFAVRDIRDMLDAGAPSVRHSAMERGRVVLIRRIAEARTALDMIDHALDCDHEDFTACPHFQSMVAGRIGTGFRRPR